MKKLKTKYTFLIQGWIYKVKTNDIGQLLIFKTGNFKWSKLFDDFVFQICIFSLRLSLL